MAQALSPAKLKAARSSYCVFNALNSFSFVLLSGSFITLFALRLGASNGMVGLLNSFAYATFFFLPVGKALVRRRTIVGVFGWSWLFRYLAMLPVLAAFGVISLPLALLAIPVAFLGGLMFAGIAMCFTAITPGIDTLNYPAFLFITPMMLFSGTFFPLTLMPAMLQYIALAVLPLTHLVAIMRMLTLPALSWTILLNFAWIIGVAAVFCLLSINLMRRRLIV